MAAVAVLSCTGAPAPKRIDITMQGFGFSPASVEAHAGDTIAWRNADMLPHTATAAGIFDTGNMNNGATAVWVVTGGDSIDYVCTYHPTMRGRIVVKK